MTTYPNRGLFLILILPLMLWACSSSEDNFDPNYEYLPTLLEVFDKKDNLVRTNEYKYDDHNRIASFETKETPFIRLSVVYPDEVTTVVKGIIFTNSPREWIYTTEGSEVYCNGTLTYNLDQNGQLKSDFSLNMSFSWDSRGNILSMGALESSRPDYEYEYDDKTGIGRHIKSPSWLLWDYSYEFHNYNNPVRRTDVASGDVSTYTHIYNNLGYPVKIKVYDSEGKRSETIKITYTRAKQ